eukprot:TRINITY_DN61747_c0_g1_i1.p1 TRINITY_DN61747_c0_g1~~TRINITY_DN61747_c0_g1_i1.p1  ORF type:complete len:345 (+),score=72.67 TRINITY_DN61747_c0_g1_i1:137-1171(+)
MGALDNIISGGCGVCCLAIYAASFQGLDFALKMTRLQHANGNGSFRAGLDDAYTVLYLVAALTALRKAVMVAVAGPLASLLEVGDRKNVTKFKQASWVFVYYVIAFSWGLYEFYYSVYWLDVKAMFQGYPQTAAMTASYKLYFLFQIGFWFHMVFVTLIEPWQKDFPVMLAHHFVTILMLGGCYAGAVTRFGHAVLVEQDFADIFLPVAKMCNYVALGKSKLKGLFQTIADALFALFAVAWIPTRHVILPFYLYRSLFDGTADIKQHGCDCGQGTECIWAPDQLCVLTAENWWKAVIFYKVFLGFFQVLLAFWLRDLLVAIYRTLVKGSVKGVEEESAQALKED